MNAKRKQRKSKEKIEHIPKDVVAYYLPSPNSAKRIYYKRHHLTHVSFNSLKIFFKRNDTGSVLYPDRKRVEQQNPLLLHW